ncbi:MAG: hypothetical protein M3209_08560 [Acidobacteriota bacterium]|nr:hypothetical protein [Acidobacteriota bacterium]
MKTKILIFILLVSTATTAFAQRRPPKQPPRAITVVRGSVVEMGTPGAWRETVSEAGGFKASFPGIPAAPKKPDNVSMLLPPVNTGTYYLQTPAVYYNLFFGEDFYEGSEPGKLKSYYDAKRETYLKGTSFKLVGERDVFLGEHLGRERTISDDTGTTITITRIFLIKEMLYELSVTVSKRALATQQENVDKFFASFQLTEAPPKKPPMPNYEAVWGEFVSKEAEFKAAFPGVPKKQDFPGEKNTKSKSLFFSVYNLGAEFSVAVSDYAYEIEDSDVLNSAYDNTLGYFLEKPEHKVESAREIFAGKYLGREIAVKDTAKEIRMRIRLFIVGKQLYQVIAVSPLHQLSKDVGEFYEKNAVRFLDSFQIIGAVPPITTTAAQSLPAEFKGEIDEEGVYRNQFLGFTLPLPEEWNLANRDETSFVREAGLMAVQTGDAQKNAFIEKAFSRFEFLLIATKKTFGVPDNALIMLAASKTRFPAADLKDIAEGNLKEIAAASKPKEREIKIVNPVRELKLGSETFTGFDMEIQIPLGKQKQRLMFGKRNGHLLMFVIAASSDKDFAEVEQILRTLNFNAQK